MQNFKDRWQIQHNWQLIFPILGVFALFYSSYKLSGLISSNRYLIILLALVLYFVLLKFTLFLFKKLENRWIVDYKWEMIRIFLVFAITGSSSVFVGRPIMKLIGITGDNLNIIIYWILFVFIGLIFYQLLLVFFGWLFGQFQFFWNFEKKILRRFGFKDF